MGGADMTALRNTLLALAAFAYGFTIITLGSLTWPIPQ